LQKMKSYTRIVDSALTAFYLKSLINCDINFRSWQDVPDLDKTD
jgi:hypothetical protein